MFLIFILESACNSIQSWYSPKNRLRYHEVRVFISLSIMAFDPRYFVEKFPIGSNVYQRIEAEVGTFIAFVWMFVKFGYIGESAI